MRILLAILVIFFLILQYALWFGEASLPVSWERREQLEEEKEKNAQLMQRNKVLEAEVLDLKQGKDAIEERARSELGMIKEGETFYRIIEDDKKNNE